MKHNIFIFIFTSLLSISTCLNSNAQNYYEEGQTFGNDVFIPEAYIGLGLGINEIGLIGLALEIPIIDKLSLMGTAGLGGWGYKLRAGLNFYPKTLAGNNGFGILYAHSTGLNDFDFTNQNTGNNYTFNLFSAHNIDFMYNRNVFVGEKSKFVLSAGYTLSLNPDAYEEVNGQSLDSNTQQTLSILQPGGILIGIKFLFGT